MLKGPRLKTVSYRTLGSPEYGMTNASNFMGTSKGDFGVKAPPQPRQQSILGMSMATQINPRGQIFLPS